MKIILHIGMPKTATTTLQVTFDQNHVPLLESGVLYPKSGRFVRACNHHKRFLPVASCRNEIRTPFPEFPESFESMVTSVDNERRETGAEVIILSSEMLWNPRAFDFEALKRIRGAFSQYEFNIVVYLRDLESHAPSGYAQRVTGPQRSTITFKQHLDDKLTQDTYDFEKRIEVLEKVFGKKAVRPIWLPWIKDDVLSPFKVIFPGLANLKPADDRNVRKSWLFVACARSLNNLDRLKMGGLNDSLRRILNRFDDSVKRFPRFEKMFNPMDASTKKVLEEKSKMLLESLQKKHHLR